MVDIQPAHTGNALADVIAIAQDYVTWMLAEIEQNYPALDLAEFTSEHAYDNVRDKFPGEHVPPDGCLLLATVDGKAAGCIGLARLDETTCEVRTLFVRPQFRGAGAGRALVEAVLTEARRIGYTRARLDTLGFMAGAQKLYGSFGFYRIAPYLDMSEGLRQYIRFYECDLTQP